MTPEQFESLRECCRDDAAFERLQQILLASVRHTASNNAHLGFSAANSPAFSKAGDNCLADAAHTNGEDKWRSLIQNSSDIISIVQPNGTVNYISPSVERILGYSPEELIGTNSFDLIHPEDIPVVVQKLSSITVPDAIVSTQFRCRRKDGLWCFMESTGSNLLDHPSVAGIVSHSRDITQRKQMEAALAQSEARYRAIVEDQTELICRFLPDKTLTFVNEAYSRYMGKPREQLLGRNFLSLIPEKDRQQLQKHLAALSPENPVASLEEWVVMPNGELRWQMWSDRAIFDQGKLIEFQSVGRDITQAKQAQASLEESERRFRQLADNIDGIFWIFDVKTAKIIYISPAYERIWGKSCQELYDRPESVFDYIHPMDCDRALALRQKLMLGEVAEEQYRIVRSSDRSLRWIRDRGFPIKDESGQVYRICGIAEDITDRKIAAQTLRQRDGQERLLTWMLDRIRQSLNLGEILNATVAEVRQFLECDRVVIYRFQPDWSGVVIVESVGADWIPIIAISMRDTSFVESYREKYQQGRIAAIEDIYTAGLEECHINLLAQFQVRANLIVPILMSSSHGSSVKQTPAEINNPPKPELWGLLIAHQCAVPRQWQQFEIDLVSSLASHVALAIQQAQLYRQTQLQAQREQTLNRFTHAIRSFLDQETLLTTAAKEITDLLGVDRVKIYQYLSDRSVWLTVADCKHSELPTSLGIEELDNADEISHKLKRLEVVRIDDIKTLGAANQKTQPGALLLVPLHFQSFIWGSLRLMIEGRVYQWQDSEVELVCAIAQALAIAIQQAQLYQQLSNLNTDLERQVQERTLELQQKVRELQQMNNLKDDFLSTVSHELRTPLANMKMAIQMLKIAPNSDRFPRYLEILQTECNRETELINDLLDLQRLEASSYPLLLNDAVNLQQWLPNIMEPFHSRASDRAQTLTLDLSPDIPPLVSDTAGLARILAELLNNACKYTPSGGEILLRVYHQQSDRATPTPTTTFTVTNQAQIPAADLSRIFDKFYRVPNADPWKQGGTGLGLALVQKLVDQLGGTIHVESSNGLTTFTVGLPAQ